MVQQMIFAAMVTCSIMATAKESGITTENQGTLSEKSEMFVGKFFTDDSPHFVHLKSDGFVQRVRFHKSICNQIKSLRLEFPHSQKPVHVRFHKGLNQKWPALYGQFENQWCWFEVSASGLDLNQPKQNHHYIVITTTSGEEFHYSEDGESLLPWKRLSVQSNRTSSLGAWGATPVAGGGVLFKIWEPTADEVHLFLRGSNQPLVMHHDRPDLKGEHASGLHHVLYVPDAKVGDEYYFQFLKDGKYETVEVTNSGEFSAVKIDPWARELRYQEKGGQHNGYISPRAVVAEPIIGDLKGQKALSNTFDQPWLIYQIWPMAFNPKRKGGRWQQGTFKDIHSAIPHLKQLGVTAVELLPVNETRFNAGWGYALNSLTLVESTSGSRKDLAALVSAFHAAGIRVIFDAVLNHINNDLLRDPLSRPSSQSKFYHGDTLWGPKPDYRKFWVRKYLASALLDWIRNYGIDGIRDDMTKYIYQGDPSGWEFLGELNDLLKSEHPGIYRSAEELPNNVYVTKPRAEGGLGYDGQWNDYFKIVFEEWFGHYREDNRKVDLSLLVKSLIGLSSHLDHGVEQPFGSPKRTVTYLASHDSVGNADPFVRVVSGYNGLETVGRNTFKRVQPLEDPNHPKDKFRQVHNKFTHGVARLANLILFTSPGPVLFFQGEELASDRNLENEWSYVEARDNNSIPTQNVDVNRFVGSHRMPWEFLKPGEGPLDFLDTDEVKLFLGHHQFFKDMLAWRKTLTGFDEQHASQVKVYPDLSLISYVVKSDGGQFLILGNFGNQVNATWVDFPEGESGKTWWREEINSAETKYGAETNKMTNVVPHRAGRGNHVRLAPGSGAVFRLVDSAVPKEDLYLVGNFSFNKVRESLRLKLSSDGEWMETQMSITFAGENSFRISNKKGDIVFGSGKAPTFGKNSCEGYLSHAADQPDISIRLPVGDYKFRWNLKTYEFQFQPKIAAAPIKK